MRAKLSAEGKRLIADGHHLIATFERAHECASLAESFNKAVRESERLTMEERAVLAAAMSLADAPAIIKDPTGFLDRMRFLRSAVDAYRGTQR